MSGMTIEQALGVFQRRLDACSEPECIFCKDERHALATLRAEIDGLRAEVTEWKRVAAAQAELHGEAEARAERLAEALRRYGVHDQACVAANIPICTCGLDAALEQEAGHEQ